MKERTGGQKPHRELRRWQRVALAVSAAVAFGLLAYGLALRPNALAASYQTRLDAAAGKLEACFRQLDDTRQQPLFEAPDIDVGTKQQNIGTIRQAIKRCNGELAQFNQEAQTLPEQRLGGLTEPYRAARAEQREAANAAGQSRDVLEQYESLATFLEHYYTLLAPFDRYTAELHAMPDVSLLAGQVPQLASRAAELHARADDIRKLKAFAGFEGVIKPTADMVSTAADGFDYLAGGYGSADDAYIDYGFSLVEGATATYDDSVKSMPFDQLQKTYVGRQVESLPGKLQALRD